MDANEEEQGTTCAICMESMHNRNESQKERMNVSSMPDCHHTFHTSCFLDYIQHNIGKQTIQCPICRKDLLHIIVNKQSRADAPAPAPPLMLARPIPQYTMNNIDALEAQRQRTCVGILVSSFLVASCLFLIFNSPLQS